MSILQKLKEIMWRSEQDDYIALDDTITIRINKEEKKLFKAYCNLRKISMSDLIRESTTKYIEEFLNLEEKKVG